MAKGKFFLMVGCSILCFMLILGYSRSNGTLLAKNPEKSEEQNSNWQKILAAANRGNINLVIKNHPQPWLLISYSEGNRDLYQLLDSNNKKIPIDYLLSAHSTVAENDYLLFFYDKPNSDLKNRYLGTWNLHNQSFTLIKINQDTSIESKPTEVNIGFSFLLGNNKLYYTENSSTIQQLDIRTGLSKPVMQIEDLGVSRLAYVDDHVLQTVWWHGGGQLSLEYKEYNLNDGKLAKSASLFEEKYHGHLVSVTVNENQVVYQCSQKDRSHCPNWQSAFEEKMFWRAVAIIEQKIPHATQGIKRSFRSQVKCGKFDFHDRALYFNKKLSERYNKNSVFIERVTCIQ
jgi:hypothetical protein